MLRTALAGALRFRLLLVALASAVIVLGAVSLPKMHNDVLPELRSGPVLEVQTEAPGLSGQEVEQYVTVPLENNLLDGIMGVWDVRSDSLAGLSKVDLYFQPGTTELHARQLVEERLTNAFSLPNVAKPPQLIQPLSTSSRALLIGLRSSGLDPLEVSYLARWVLKPKLSGVPGVANVAIFGQQDRQIQVQVNPQRLAQHQVTLQQVIDTAGNSQLVSPLSYLEGSAPGTGGFLDGPNQRLDIRPVLPLGAPKDLSTVPIADAAGHVSLGQVANVVQGHQPLIGNAVTQGSNGLVLEVQKLPSASLVGVTTGVQRALAELRPALRGVSVDTSFFKPASYASEGLSNLTLGLVIAGILTILALAALLLGMRAVVVGVLSIALSLTGSLLVLQWLGQTVNPLLVLGLLIAAVVLVDDAVGSAYALERSLRTRGAGRRAQAAHNGNGAPHEGTGTAHDGNGTAHNGNGAAHNADGTGQNGNGALLNGAARTDPAAAEASVVRAFSELRRTLGYATLIVLLIVAPVFFAHGLTARYLHPMVLSLALAVLASALIAVTVTPALGVLLFERYPPRARRGVQLASEITATYERGLRVALRIPQAALLAIGIVGAAGIIALPFLHQPAPPRFKDRNLVIQWSGPPGAGLGEMDRITARATTELRRLPGVADVAATLGRAVSADRIVDPSSGQIYVALKPNASYDRAVQQVRQIVLGTPGITASISTYESDRQADVLAAPGPTVSTRVYGEDYGQLRALATELRRRMAGIGGLGPTQVRLPAQEPNIEVTINDSQARDAGVLPGDARRQASTLVSGLTVGNFFADQAVFEVVVIGEPRLRATMGDVSRLAIDTSGGGQVSLSSIAHIAVRPDPVDIQHQALSRYVDVVAPLRTGDVGSARAALAHSLAGMRFPRGYRAEVVGGTPEDPTSHSLFVVYMAAAAIFGLLLLQLAFSSWRLAATFLLTVPVSLVGGLLVALATGQLGSLGADAGLLAVLALAVRQGVVLVATVRRLHALDGGEMRPSLLMRAANERVEPSLAAVAVSAAALIPFVVLGDVAGNEITHTAAAVTLGGLITSAMWTQLLLPALCLRLAPSAPQPPEQSLEGIDPLALAAPPEEIVVRVKGKV